jgi:hypothetical protein
MSTSASSAFNLDTAADVSRRATLLILGALPLGAALMGPLTVGARSSDKRARKKARRKARQIAEQRCLAQVEQCRAYFTDACESPDPSECLEWIGPCCEYLGSCDAISFISCLLES